MVTCRSNNTHKSYSHQPHRLQGSLKHFIHLFNLPVDIPLFNVGEPPGGHRQTCWHVDADQPVVGYSQEIIFLASSESVGQSEKIWIIFHGWRAQMPYSDFEWCFWAIPGTKRVCCSAKLSDKMTILCLINENSYSMCLNFSVTIYLVKTFVNYLYIPFQAFCQQLIMKWQKKPKLDS